MPQIGKLTTEAVQALIEAALPWIINIDPFHTPKSQVNWNNLQAHYPQVHCGLKYSSGQQNAEITWDIVLAAGTWNFNLIHQQDTSMGIYTVQIDGVTIGTIDGYAGSTIELAISSIAGFIITATKKFELKLKMATKNGSAGSYVGNITSIQLLRTA